ncbi:hypothetical protein ATANTOWER_005763 [Ataeniobius toweri]|uniref:Uncharacterized protein n=1 Tax=Ataeniobius toweri TaxID=208326 RepID=A0ABU7B3D9_9TELE|nr:hypothetical protein [Ataeniobius toweri]
MTEASVYGSRAVPLRHAPLPYPVPLAGEDRGVTARANPVHPSSAIRLRLPLRLLWNLAGWFHLPLTLCPSPSSGPTWCTPPPAHRLLEIGTSFPTTHYGRSGRK